MLAVLLVGCAPDLVHPDLATLTAQHTRVAVAPLTWHTVLERPHRRLTPEQVAAQGEAAGRALQAELARQLQRRVPHLQVQDPQRTRVLLTEPPPADGPIEQAERLGVDAIISGSVVQSRALRTGVAIALEVLGGFSGDEVFAPTTSIDVMLSVHDGETGTLLWQCESGGLGELDEDPQEIADEALRWCGLPRVYR